MNFSSLFFFTLTIFQYASSEIGFFGAYVQIKVISYQDCELAMDLKYWMGRHASRVINIHVCTSCILECPNVHGKAFFSTNLTKAIYAALL